jgi:hypothetical protein
MPALARLTPSPGHPPAGIILWAGQTDPGPWLVHELGAGPPGLRRFAYEADGRQVIIELPANPTDLYDAEGRYQVRWQQRNGDCWHYTWAAAVRSGGFYRNPPPHEAASLATYLPSSIAGLRKLLQRQHPDKNGGAEGPMFRAAKTKLDILKKRQRR